MTNTKKVVFAKLFSKEALKAQKAQKLSKQRKFKFASISDIDTLNSMVASLDIDVTEKYKDLYSEWSNLITLSSRLNIIYLDMENLIEDYRDLETRVIKDTEDIGNQARELGIDLSEIPAVQELLDNFANMEDNIKSALQIMPDVESAINSL